MKFERKEVIGDSILYQGDCRDILPFLDPVDACVCDPPYGIGESSKRNATRGRSTDKWGKSGNSKAKAFTNVFPDSEWDRVPIDHDTMMKLLQISKWQIIFGGNYYNLPVTSCWLIWDKLNGDTDFADCEMAWTNLPKAVRRIQFLWNGMCRANGESRGDHLTQKPIGVMKWCIGHLPPDVQTILDPFAGSGTTGVAAIQCGKSFIGIEREPTYFETMCRRIEAARKQPDMFISPPEPKPIQGELIP